MAIDAKEEKEREEVHRAIWAIADELRGAEQKIRKYLVDNNCVDCVIQLPSNLFFGTSIATCIMVMKKSKKDNAVLFIDASKECVKVTNNNKLTQENINHIVDAFAKREDIQYFCRLVPYGEVEENSYNLSISTYVEAEDTREKIDIVKLNAEIEEIVAREQVLREEIAKIISEIDDIVKDIRCIIETSQSSAYRAVNRILVQRNWLIGHRIAVEDLKGNNRAEYGAEIIVELSKILTAEYGKGFTKTNLYHFYSFYKTYPEIFHTVCGKSKELLSWSHYRVLLQVNDKTARDWYEQEAREQTWSVRTLQRNVSSQYYYRMLKSQNKPAVENEMKRLTADYQADKLEFIKNPVVAEFLGMASNTDFTESDLEKSILSNLQKFLMELGKGYAFVARQRAAVCLEV